MWLRILRQEAPDGAEIECAFERRIAIVAQHRHQLAAVTVDGEEAITKLVELRRRQVQYEAFLRLDGDAEQQTLV